MGKVISLQEKLETWKKVYEKSELCVYVSNHGKFRIIHSSLSLQSTTTQLEFLDSVFFLKELSEALERAMLNMDLYNQNI